MTTTFNDGKQPFDLPVGLEARCMRENSDWTQDFVEAALHGYRQFMKLKLQLQDFRATRLSPSIVVDQVWHQHILDVEHYVQACTNYAGELIVHNPDGGLDCAQRNERIKATQLSLKHFFGAKNIDPQVWNFEDDLEPPPKKQRVAVKQEQTQRDAPLRRSARISTAKEEESQQEKNNGDRTLVLFRLPCGKITYLPLKPRTPMGEVFVALKLKWNTETEYRGDFRFHLDGGERVYPRDTVTSLELKDGEEIDVVLEQCGC